MINISIIHFDSSYDGGGRVYQAFCSNPGLNADCLSLVDVTLNCVSFSNVCDIQAGPEG